MNFQLLRELVSIPGAASDEGAIRDFLLQYIVNQQNNWKCKPKIYWGEEWQDQLILVFGKPKTAIFAHMDTVGYSVGYGKQLIKVGGPKMEDGVMLVGADSQGSIECELTLMEEEDGGIQPEYIFERTIEPGTLLTHKIDFRETNTTLQTAYLDNRLGVFVALKVAETLENGAIIFSTYEEHGGISVAVPAKFLQEKYGMRQALICDITWATEGVQQGSGVAISMRDSGLPRRSYLNRILQLAEKSGIPFQREVESGGGSDGTQLQKSGALWDWCFIGAAEKNVHSPNELVQKKDVYGMISMYQYLMNNL